MDVCYHVRTSQREHIVVTLQQSRHILKAVSPEVLFSETVGLDLRSHCTIENKNPFFHNIVKSTHRVIIYKL